MDLSDVFVRNSILSLASANGYQEEEEIGPNLHTWELGDNLFGDTQDADEAGRLYCVQQLIIKGLYQPHTELLSIQVSVWGYCGE